jgi:hypothetical protein
MNRTLSMLNGYVGEAIAEYWLRKRFPAHELTREILPTGLPPRGGPSIDFGILTNNVVESLYEVKTQDYTFDGKSTPGVGLSFVWSQTGRSLTFKTKDGRIIQSSPSMTSTMICLRPPNAHFLAKIGNHHIKDIMLFQELWADLTEEEAKRAVMDRLQRDICEVLTFLRNPAGSVLQAKAFLELRRSVIEKPISL